LKLQEKKLVVNNPFVDHVTDPVCYHTFNVLKVGITTSKILRWSLWLR